MFYHNLKNKLGFVKTITTEEYQDLLKNCKTDVCSMVEYFNVLPVKNYDNVFAVWLSTSNVEDNRSFDIIVEKDDKLISENNVDVKTAQYWYQSYIFEPGSEYVVALYDGVDLKKLIHINDNYFNNKLKNNGLLTIK